MHGLCPKSQRNPTTLGTSSSITTRITSIIVRQFVRSMFLVVSSRTIHRPGQQKFLGNGMIRQDNGFSWVDRTGGMQLIHQRWYDRSRSFPCFVGYFHPFSMPFGQDPRMQRGIIDQTDRMLDIGSVSCGGCSSSTSSIGTIRTETLLDNVIISPG